MEKLWKNYGKRWKNMNMENLWNYCGQTMENLWKNMNNMENCWKNCGKTMENFWKNMNNM